MAQQKAQAFCGSFAEMAQTYGSPPNPLIDDLGSLAGYWQTVQGDAQGLVDVASPSETGLLTEMSNDGLTVFDWLAHLPSASKVPSSFPPAEDKAANRFKRDFALLASQTKPACPTTVATTTTEPADRKAGLALKAIMDPLQNETSPLLTEIINDLQRAEQLASPAGDSYVRSALQQVSTIGSDYAQAVPAVERLTFPYSTENAYAKNLISDMVKVASTAVVLQDPGTTTGFQSDFEQFVNAWTATNNDYAPLIALLGP